jgi:hypothetical protein
MDDLRTRVEALLDRWVQQAQGLLALDQSGRLNPRDRNRLEELQRLATELDDALRG